MTEFEYLVKKMRDWQKMYFRKRGAMELAMSKEAERKVDAYLRDIEQPKLPLEEAK